MAGTGAGASLPKTTAAAPEALGEQDDDEYDSDEYFSSAKTTSAKSTSSLGSRVIRDSFTRGRAKTLMSVAHYSKPQIVLEIISGRTACWIIVITYFVAVLSFSIDTYYTVKGLDTTSKSPVSGIHTCTSLEAKGYGLNNAAKNNAAWGCFDEDYLVWKGFFPEINDVLLASVQFTAKNFSTTGISYYTHDEVVDREYEDFGNLYMTVGSSMWACFKPHGCEDKFADKAQSSVESNGYEMWQSVLSAPHKNVSVVQSDGTPIKHGEKGKTAVMQFVSMFQNQEALPTNSPVKSYYIILSFTDVRSFEYLVEHNSHGQFIFDWLHREAGELKLIATILTAFMIVITLVATGVFVVLVYRHRVMKGRKWLAEQVWYLIYTGTVIMYQNPVYLLQNYVVPSPGESLCAFVSSFLSQCMLLVVWLMYADAINHHAVSSWHFYGPKVAYGSVMFLAICVVLALQFPTFTIGSTRSPVLSTQNWAPSEQMTLLVASITFIGLFLFWAFVWLHRLFKTYRQLNRLPYMSTRYHQLLFRFFFLQATLVTLYYVAQYSVAMYFVAHNHFYGYNEQSIADNINTLIRQQTQLFGKTVFITAFSMILGFILLPPEVLQHQDGTIMSSFALDEEEHDWLVQQRLEYKKSNRGNRFKASLTAKSSCVFTVSTTLDLLHCSNSAYGDGGESETKEDNDEYIREELEKHGFKLIEVVSDAEADSQMVVARHQGSNRLVFSFRGTQSRQNMNANLNYRKKYINFKDMPLPHIDELDQLGEVYVEEEDDEQTVDSDVPLCNQAISELASDVANKFVSGALSGAESLKTGLGDMGLQGVRKVGEGADKFKKGVADARENFAASRIGKGISDLGNEAKKAAKRTKKGVVKVRSFAGMDKAPAARAEIRSARENTACVFDASADSTADGRPNHKSLPTKNDKFKDILSNGGKTLVSGFKTLKDRTVDGVEGTLGVATAGYHGVKDTVTNVVDITSTLALETIGFNSISDTVGVHRGFLSIFMSLRDDMHRIFRREMRKGLTAVHITGHSMGGACATLAALDLLTNSMPRVRAHHRKFNPTMDASDVADLTRVTMVNFGSPRLGDHAFRRVFNKCVPDSFRVVVDGDIVTTVPKTSMGFKHIGTQVLIDRSTAGNIIIDPSFVERWLRLRKTSSLSIRNNPHLLDSYYESLTSVVHATNAMRKLAETSRPSDDFIEKVLRNAQEELTLDTMEDIEEGPEGGESDDEEYYEGYDEGGEEGEAEEEEDKDYDEEELEDEAGATSPLHAKLQSLPPLIERTSLSRASLSEVVDKDLASARRDLSLPGLSAKSEPDLSALSSPKTTLSPTLPPVSRDQKMPPPKRRNPKSTTRQRVHSMRGSMEFVAHVGGGSFDGHEAALKASLSASPAPVSSPSPKRALSLNTNSATGLGRTDFWAPQKLGEGKGEGGAGAEAGTGQGVELSAVDKV